MSDVTLTDLLMCETGLKDGAEGRGSRHRYRRAVADAIEEWEHYAEDHDETALTARAYDEREEEVRQVRLAWMHRRASRRARAILARLDGHRLS
jgi:hypothetical protein